MKIDEFTFISKFRGLFNVSVPEDVQVKNGDDAAVVANYAVTMDSFVEGIHFLRKWMEPEDIGYKAVAINLSDLAAMGARPHMMFVDFGIPENEDDEFMMRVTRKMAEISDNYGIYLAGGNVTGSNSGLRITITMVGIVSGHILTRTGAVEGDGIFVSGPVSRAEIGRRVLEKGLNEYEFKDEVDRFRRPVPRVELGEKLSLIKGVHAAIDISDGLGADLGHVLEESKKGAIINVEKIPGPTDLDKYCTQTGEDPVDLLLNGGEEYELLVIADPMAVKHYVEAKKLYPIGKITGERSVQYLIHGKAIDNGKIKGWRHF